MHNTASHSRCIAGQSVCPQKQCFAAAMVLQVRSALLLQPATTTLVLIPAVLAALLCSGTELRCTGEQLADRHWLDFYDWLEWRGWDTPTATGERGSPFDEQTPAATVPVLVPYHDIISLLRNSPW
jgi:hypothetical protein